MSEFTQELLTDAANKKRRVDKDGFVCPSSSDIPRSSNQYGDDHQFNGIDSYEPQSSGDHTVSSYFHPSDQRDGQSGGQVPTQLGDAGRNSDEKPGAVIHALLSEFTNDLMQTVSDWSPALRQSLDFEADCSDKLDSLLGEAHSLETSLSTQRNVLYQRLRGIGQTLSQED